MLANSVNDHVYEKHDVVLAHIICYIHYIF